MPETSSSEWIDRVRKDHRELGTQVTTLRRFLKQPRPKLGAKGSHAWSAELARQLVALHDGFNRHFREEEEGGMMHDLAERHPRATYWIDRLAAEHKEMLGQLRRATATALRYSEGTAKGDPPLRRELMKLLELHRSHEHAETDLIQRLEYEELGLGH